MVIIEQNTKKFLNFINNDDLFIDIYKEQKKNILRKLKSFKSELKDVKNHENYELPYSYNPKRYFTTMTTRKVFIIIVRVMFLARF